MPGASSPASGSSSPGSATRRCVEELLGEARELLETQPAGPELVTAYTYTAGRCMRTGRYPEAVAAAERALMLAAELGLPEAAFALSWRGVARCELGQADGVEDVRRALDFALEQGQGRETGVIYALLSVAVWSYQGPQSALDTAAEGIAFCERRGITEMALQTRANIIDALAELGQTEQALTEVGPLADRQEAAGDMAWLTSRALQLRLLAETGTSQHASDPEPLLAAARETGLPDAIAGASGAAAQLLLAQGQREHAHALLRELDQLAPGGAALVSGLPSLLRSALALGDPPLVQRLSAAIEPVTPLHEHALASARAQLAEATGDRAAAELYGEAAEGWREFETSLSARSPCSPKDGVSPRSESPGQRSCYARPRSCSARWATSRPRRDRGAARRDRRGRFVGAFHQSSAGSSKRAMIPSSPPSGTARSGCRVATQAVPRSG